MIDAVRTVPKTKQVQELDFVFIGDPRPFQLTLDVGAGDDLRQQGNALVVHLRSKGDEIIEINRDNLLFYSSRIRTVELPAPGESAIEKHLESLRQEQTAPPVSQPKAS